MRCLILLALATVTSTAHAKPGALKGDWEALLAGGCDLKAHAVRTPFAASVLRNTPYALAGYAFKSEGLRSLFSADGGWYAPKGNTTVTFDAKVGACIKKIKALEATMKPKERHLEGVQGAALQGPRDLPRRPRP